MSSSDRRAPPPCTRCSPWLPVPDTLGIPDIPPQRRWILRQNRVLRQLQQSPDDDVQRPALSVAKSRVLVQNRGDPEDQQHDRGPHAPQKQVLVHCPPPGWAPAKSPPVRRSPVAAKDPPAAAVPLARQSGTVHVPHQQPYGDGDDDQRPSMAHPSEAEPAQRVEQKQHAQQDQHNRPNGLAARAFQLHLRRNGCGYGGIWGCHARLRPAWWRR